MTDYQQFLSRAAVRMSGSAIRLMGGVAAQHRDRGAGARTAGQRLAGTALEHAQPDAGAIDGHIDIYPRPAQTLQDDSRRRVYPARFFRLRAGASRTVSSRSRSSSPTTSSG